MSYTTIRRDAFKKFETILSAAVLIREYKYDDMGDTLGTVTKEKVLEVGRGELKFDRVSMDERGIVRFTVHQNWSFTAYPTVESARATLTADAFAKYFPEATTEAAAETLPMTPEVAANPSNGYTADLIEKPATLQEGLGNVVQLAINLLERGDSAEALLQLVDLLDDVASKSNPYRIGKAPARKPASEYRGTVNVD